MSKGGLQAQESRNGRTTVSLLLCDLAFPTSLLLGIGSTLSLRFFFLSLQPILLQDERCILLSRRNMSVELSSHDTT